MVILAAATLITLDFQSFGPLGTIQNGAREIVSPVRDGGSRILSPITGVWRGATDYDDLESENQELRDEIDRLRGELVRSGIDRGDYEALLREAGLESTEAYPLLLARVRRGQIGNFGSSVIELEVGTADGVQQDMAVVTAAGLVGRIEQADRTSSTVRLVSDPDFVIGAEVAGEVGLARGHGSNETIEITQGIDGRAAIEDGDPVVTTRSERSLFPPNIVIGTVIDTSVADDVSTTTVTVELAADPSDLRFVSVVLIEPGAEVDETPTGVAG
jgi:rod shape-determining protein MreC